MASLRPTLSSGDTLPIDREIGIVSTDLALGRMQRPLGEERQGGSREMCKEEQGKVPSAGPGGLQVVQRRGERGNGGANAAPSHG